MRYFLDTEFNEDTEGVTLLSLALRREDGADLYLVDNQIDYARCSPWVNAHVVPQLLALPAHFLGPAAVFPSMLEDFLDGDQGAEIWGYYAAYDWFLFCRLWGGLLNLPRSVRRYCSDIAQMRDTYAPGQKLKDVVPVVSPEHNARADARWNSAAYAWLLKNKALNV